MTEVPPEIQNAYEILKDNDNDIVGVHFDGIYELVKAEHGCTKVTLTVKMKVQLNGRRSKGGASRRVSQRGGAMLKSISSKLNILSPQPLATPPPELSRASSTSSGLSERNSSINLLDWSDAVQVLIHFTKSFDHFYNCFARPGELDRARINAFIEKIPKAAPLTSAEAALVKRGLELSAAKGVGWQRIWTRSPLHMFKRYIPPQPAAWGKAVCRVDCSAKRLLSYIWNYDLEEKVKKSRANGDYHRKAWYVEGGRSSINVQYVKSPSSAVKSRVFTTWASWDKVTLQSGESSYVLSLCPVEEFNHIDGEWTDYISKIRDVVHGEARACHVFKETSSATCEWTFLVYAHARGFIPSWAIDWKLGETLHWACDQKMKFENRDANNAFLREFASGVIEMSPRPVNATDMVKRCQAVEVHNDDEWEKTFRETPFVRVRSLRGKVRAETTVDCSCSEALSWFFHLPEAVFNRSVVWEPFFALPLSRSDEHTKTSVVYPFSLPLRAREFVVNYTWTREEEGAFCLFFETVDDDNEKTIDYGGKKSDYVSSRMIRGDKKGFVRFIPIADVAELKRCKVEFIAEVDLKIRKSIFSCFRQSHGEQCLLAQAAHVSLCRAELNKDLEIDNHLISVVQRKFESDNGRLLDRHIQELSEQFNQKFRTEKSKMRGEGTQLVTTQVSRQGLNIYITQQFTVDARSSVIVPYLFSPELRTRVKKSWENGIEILVESNDLNLKSQDEEGKSRKYVSYFFFEGDAVARKRLASATCLYSWSKLPNGSAILAISSIDAPSSSISLGTQMSGLFPTLMSRKALNQPGGKIKLESVAEMTPLDPVGFVPQTHVKFKTIIDISNSGLTAAASERIIDKVVKMNGVELFQEFESSNAIDKVSFEATLHTLRTSEQKYSKEEADLIAKGMPYLDLFENENKKKGMKSVSLSSPLVKGKMLILKQGTAAIGCSSCVIRADHDEVLSFIWGVDSRLYRKMFDYVEQETLLKPNDHSRLNYVRMAIGPGFADREYLGWAIWKKVNDDVFLHVTMPIEHAKKPINKNFARGKYTSITKLTRLGKKETRIGERQRVAKIKP